MKPSIDHPFPMSTPRFLDALRQNLELTGTWSPACGSSSVHRPAAVLGRQLLVVSNEWGTWWLMSSYNMSQWWLHNIVKSYNIMIYHDQFRWMCPVLYDKFISMLRFSMLQHVTMFQWWACGNLSPMGRGWQQCGCCAPVRNQNSREYPKGFPGGFMELEIPIPPYATNLKQGDD